MCACVRARGSERVSVIAPLWMCALGWQIADRLRVQQQVMGVCVCGVLGSLIVYRSTSILFSTCQNSQLCIDSSVLHLNFSQSKQQNQDEANCCQVKSAQPGSRTSIFIKSCSPVSEEYWFLSSLKGAVSSLAESSWQFTHREEHRILHLNERDWSFKCVWESNQLYCIGRGPLEVWPPDWMHETRSHHPHIRNITSL